MKEKKKKKKVCHITSAHNSNDIRVFVKECASLAENGFETYLVAEGENKEINNVKILGIGKKPTNRFVRMVFFARKAYRIAKETNCDIYHIHDPELLPYGLKLLKAGKKVIFDSH